MRAALRPGGEDTEALALRLGLAHRIQNDSVAKKAAAATTQPSLRALVRRQPRRLIRYAPVLQ